MAKPHREPQKAAQYVRMSTDRQDLSIVLQKGAIASYAAQRGIQVVASYADEAKSGLRIKNRQAMQRLMGDVTDPHCPFSSILVYDISRWGRFQDTDESAYWDYHCRRHGVEVVYVAEGFSNDATPYAALMKSLKRAMAAEYSRELGVKVLAGMQKLAAMGHKMSGVPSLGLVRQVIAADGTPKLILGLHEHKAIQSDRVRLVPGPPEEVALVRLIFERYAGTDMGLAALARQLTREGYRARGGRVLSEGQLQFLIRSECFMGDYVWGKKRVLSNGRRVPLPAEEQRRVAGVIEPIVARDLWRRANEKLRLRMPKVRSKHQLLTDLRTALDDDPGLGCLDLRSHGCATLKAYRKAFGSFIAARNLASPGAEARAKEEKRQRYYRSYRIGRAFRSDLANLLSSAGAEVSYGPKQCVLKVNGRRVQVQVAWPRILSGAKTWFVGRHPNCTWDYLVILRMNDDESARDFYVVPERQRLALPTMLTETNAPKVDALRATNAEILMGRLLAHGRACGTWQMGQDRP